MTTQKQIITALISLLCGFIVTSQSPLQVARDQLRQATTTKDSIKAYQDLAWFSQVSKLDSSFYYNEQAQILIDRINDIDASITNLKERAGYLYRAGEYKAAVQSYNKAKKWYDNNNDQLNVAKVNSNLGAVYQSMSESEEAMNSYIAALSYFESDPKNDPITATILCNIGVVYKSVYSYKEAEEFYSKAERIYRKSSPGTGLINALSNLGSVYIKMNLLDKATLKLEEAQQLAEDQKNLVALSAILQNLGTIALEKERYTAAEDYFKQSYLIKMEQGDLNQASTSQASLGKVQITNNKLEDAIKNLNSARVVFEKNNNREKLLSVYPSLNNAFARLQQHDSASHYLKKYSELSNLIAEENAAGAVTDIEKKYQVEKKERQLAENKSLLLEQELALRERNFLLVLLSFILIASIIAGVLFYKQQQLKNKQLIQEAQLREAQAKIDSQQKLQDQRLRISRDLHDNIGSQLTFLISSLENLKYHPNLEKTILDKKLDQLSVFTRTTIDELRDTIWAMNKDSITINELKERLQSHCTKAVNMGITTQFNIDLSPQVKGDHLFNPIKGIHIFRVIQESINNAIKYAKATCINVTFSKIEQGLRIAIKDDGSGFDLKESVDGNGLRNMKERANSVDGRLEIESASDKGTTITLEVPMGSSEL